MVREASLDGLMNKRLRREEFDTIKKFDYYSGQHIDCIRFDHASGENHRKKLLELCNEAMSNGHHFLTEARLRTEDDTGLVADFVDLFDGDVVEILDSETDSSFQKKKAIYESLGINCIGIRVNEAS